MKFFSHENYNRIAYQILSSFFLFISYLYEVFSEGEEGISWYIILKGSVNVVVHGKVRHIRLPSSDSEDFKFAVQCNEGICYTFILTKGVVCQLNEGDDFGKLALVNNALR